MHLPAHGEASTRAGQATGVLKEANVDARVSTNIVFRKAGLDPDSPAPPFEFPTDWSFSWDSSSPDAVDFSGTVTFGDHYSVTDAGSLGGISTQTFHGYEHSIKGKAKWDAASRTLTYRMDPEDRDDSRASTVKETAPIECEPDGLACGAFMKLSPEFEGLVLELTFGEELSDFSGRMVLSQYGGNFVTKQQTDLVIELSGELQ